MGILWARSGTVEFDNSAVRAPGAKAFFYEGGTTTPLAVFQDADENNPHTDPVEADINGRWPTVFIPYIASYDVKITTSGGTQLSYPTEIPNPDPVEAAADTAEDADLFLTGDVKFRHGTGTLNGYVRCNGRTIGSAASGATERANDDCADLYAYLWGGFSNSILAVTGGRGGSAATDFAANKPIALFDMRLGGAVGVDDMGNSAAGRGGSITFASGSSTTGGSHLGANTHTIAEAQLPTHSHAVSIASGNASADHTHTAGTLASDSNGAHTHSITNGSSIAQFAASATTVGAGGLQLASVNLGTDSQGAHTHTVSGSTGGMSATHTHNVIGSTAPIGSGTAHNIVQYGVSGTWYIKL